MKIDFNKLKTSISLPDFLLKFGWSFAKGSSRSAPKMTNGFQTIVIKKNSSEHYTYWDVHTPEIRGKSIIDFMQQHLLETTGQKNTLYEVGVILNEYIKNNEIILPDDSKYTVNNSSIDNDNLYIIINSLKPYHGDFLQERGLNIEILSTPTFKDTIFSRTYISNNTIYNNICVKMINEKGIRGLSQRNHSFKGILGSHFDTIAVSNHDKERAIEKIYVGESFIDCMSHYELNNFNNDKNIIYISTEGNIAEGQINLIKLLIEKNNINSVTTIFDNDKQGYKFTILLISTLKKIECMEETKQTVLQLNDETFKTEFSTHKDWNEDLKQKKINIQMKHNLI